MRVARPGIRLLVAALLGSAPLFAGADAPEGGFGIGRAASPADIARRDIDVGPDGAGLPPGHGTPLDGEPIYAQKCSACHGTDGRAGRDRLVGDARHAAIGNHWPYATTIFDYVRRAMPPTAPGSLADAEVYALTAYLLYLNGLIGRDARIDAQTLPQVAMPARERFVVDDRRGGPEVR